MPHIHFLPIESILATDGPDRSATARIIGHSREDRPILAHEIGTGSIRVSLIAGCHADEPVGPAMLHLLVRFLEDLEPENPLLTECLWCIVPHVNPDGEHRNRAWSTVTVDTIDYTRADDRGYDVVRYLEHVVREPPGEDIEFGFPRDAGDKGARPENRAVAGFLAQRPPYHLHGSFHGMGLAPGPWFLIEPDWIERTTAMRQALRRDVRAMAYPLFDVDRQGEKGFHRIDPGFSTRPDSGAMSAHFLERDDAETAALFRPSSMEWVRGLGGDPLTLVSEMPLFLTPETAPEAGEASGTEERRRLHRQLGAIVATRGEEAARREISELGIRPMPIRDQMRLQLAFLSRALHCVRPHV